MKVRFKGRDGSLLALELRRDGVDWSVHAGDEIRPVRVLERVGSRIVFELDGAVHCAHVRVTKTEVRLVLAGRERAFTRHDPVAAQAVPTGELHEPVLRAPVPGRVLQVRVPSGAPVEAGDVLVVIEAMKMETPIVAPASGSVQEVHVTDGQLVEQDQPLVTCVYS